MSENSKYFQDHMPENICFGCGSNNHQGLRIKSYWDGQIARCEWMPDPKHQGWKNLLNGGIMATLVDCHCMCTSMAYAYRNEDRSLDSEPLYRYATGTMHLRYLKPVFSNAAIHLEAEVLTTQGKKTTLRCLLKSKNIVHLEAEVIAIRVYDSNQPQENSPFN